jgi:hypothetical protein
VTDISPKLARALLGNRLIMFYPWMLGVLFLLLAIQSYMSYVSFNDIVRNQHNIIESNHALSEMITTRVQQNNAIYDRIENFLQADVDISKQCLETLRKNAPSDTDKK